MNLNYLLWIVQPFTDENLDLGNVATTQKTQNSMNVGLLACEVCATTSVNNEENVFHLL